MKPSFIILFLTIISSYCFSQGTLKDWFGDEWIYTKTIDSLYFVQKSNEISTEIGYAKSLNPFLKIDTFYTLNQYFDTVFVEVYDEKSNIIGYNVFKEYDDVDSEIQFTDEMPQFNGGEDSLMRFIAKYIEYPLIQSDCSIEGTVYVKFIVIETGEVVNAQILRGFDPFFDKSALKIISLLPNFKPGKLDGKPVVSEYLIPVIFKLH